MGAGAQINHSLICLCVGVCRGEFAVLMEHRAVVYVCECVVCNLKAGDVGFGAVINP